MKTRSEGNYAKLEAVISHIKEAGEGLRASIIVELSDLSNNEVIHVRNAIADIDTEVKISVISLLGELCENDASLDFDALYRMFLKDKDAEVRTASIQILWECDKPSLIRRFIDMLNKDESPKVRSAAAQALGKFALLAEQRTLSETKKKELAKVLYGKFNNGSEAFEVRKRALEAVSVITGEQTTEAIKKAYTSGNLGLKTSAIYSMGRNLDSRWLPVLVAEAGNSSPQIRYESALAMGEMGDESTAVTLIKLAGDDDKEVQLAAIHALGEVGGKEAEEALKKCLTSPSEAIRTAALQALDEIKQVSKLPMFDLNEG